MKNFITATAFVILSTGCFHASFQRSTGDTYGKVVDRAHLVYKNDIAKFNGCDMVELGTIGADGNSFVDQEAIGNHASKIAAERGATHVFVGEAYDNYLTTYSTKCSGNNCLTTPNNYRKPHGTFVALRITCDTDESRKDYDGSRLTKEWGHQW